LYLEFERALNEAELAPLRELVRRRGLGEPLQHLLGTVEFCGHTFLCDKRAMVPRPETEQLVELLQSRIENRKSRIVDVGTGSGVIALSLAKKFPETEVFAVDVSEDALALARENAARLGLTGRVQLSKGDLLKNISERFDLIVANLPYISMQDRHLLSREVLRDPEVALFAGTRGDKFRAANSGGDVAHPRAVHSSSRAGPERYELHAANSDAPRRASRTCERHSPCRSGEHCIGRALRCSA